MYYYVLEKNNIIDFLEMNDNIWIFAIKLYHRYNDDDICYQQKREIDLTASGYILQ